MKFKKMQWLGLSVISLIPLTTIACVDPNPSSDGQKLKPGQLNSSQLEKVRAGFNFSLTNEGYATPHSKMLDVIKKLSKQYPQNPASLNDLSGYDIKRNSEFRKYFNLTVPDIQRISSSHRISFWFKEDPTTKILYCHWKVICIDTNNPQEYEGEVAAEGWN